MSVPSSAAILCTTSGQRQTTLHTPLQIGCFRIYRAPIWRRQLTLCTAKKGSSNTDPYALLGISRRASRAEIRDAYLGLIREHHPDVSTDEDSTELTAQLNAAYTELMLGMRGSQDEDFEPLDVFDFPEAEPDRLFVNPFACSINPIEWRKLQEVAREGGDPEESLLRAGVSASSSAICYLTPGQLAAVEAELKEMEQALSFEMSAWVLTDCLSRARYANKRMPLER